MYLVIVFNNKGHIKKVFIKYKGHKVCIVGKVCKKKKKMTGPNTWETSPHRVIMFDIEMKGNRPCVNILTSSWLLHWGI